MKKVISFVLIFILLFFNLTIQNYAKSDYEIDLPSSYEETYEDTYKDDKNHMIVMSTEDGRYKDEEEIYTKDTLNEVITLMYQYISYYGDVAVIEKEITRFTENKYECFEFVFEINTAYTGVFYQKYYISVSGNDLFIICIQSDEYGYFETKEFEDIINSITVEDLVGRKQQIELLWKRIFIIGGILIGIVFLIGIYNKVKEKTLYEKSQVLIHQQELAKKRAERELQKNLGTDKFAAAIQPKESGNFTAINQNLIDGTYSPKLYDTTNSREFTTNKNENTSEKTITKRKCPNCGKEVEIYWAFCNECGHKMQKNEE